MDWTEDLPAITATRDFLQQHRQAAEITSLAKKATWAAGWFATFYEDK